MWVEGERASRSREQQKECCASIATVNNYAFED
jgi:hypothetical protein